MNTVMSHGNQPVDSREAALTAAVARYMSCPDFLGGSVASLTRETKKLCTALLSAARAGAGVSLNALQHHIAELGGADPSTLAAVGTLSWKQYLDPGLAKIMVDVYAVIVPIAAAVGCATNLGLKAAYAREADRLGRALTSQEKDLVRPNAMTRCKDAAVTLLTATPDLIDGGTVFLDALTAALAQEASGHLLKDGGRKVLDDAGRKLVGERITTLQRSFVGSYVEGAGTLKFVPGRAERWLSHKTHLGMVQCHDLACMAVARLFTGNIVRDRDLTWTDLVCHLGFVTADELGTSGPADIWVEFPEDDCAGAIPADADPQDDVELSVAVPQWLTYVLDTSLNKKPVTTTGQEDSAKESVKKATTACRLSGPAKQAPDKEVLACTVAVIEGGDCADPSTCLALIGLQALVESAQDGWTEFLEGPEQNGRQQSMLDLLAQCLQHQHGRLSRARAYEAAAECLALLKRPEYYPF